MDSHFLHKSEVIFDTKFQRRRLEIFDVGGSFVGGAFKGLPIRKCPADRTKSSANSSECRGVGS